MFITQITPQSTLKEVLRTMIIMLKGTIILVLSLINGVMCFQQQRWMVSGTTTKSNYRSTKVKLRAISALTYAGSSETSFNPFFDNKNNHNFDTGYSKFDLQVRPSITDRARTIAHVCTTGTLCTTSSKNDIAGIPFGSYVDYILNEQGWPIVLLNMNAVHTQNIEHNNKVSLFIQLPKLPYGQTMAAVSRVTMMGTVQKISDDDALNAIKLAFLLVHPHTEAIIDSRKFQFYEIKPLKIFFAGGFGVSSDWINVTDYEHAQPDIIAHEVTSIMSRINLEKQSELKLLCKHFLDISSCDQIRIQSIDRLGIDLRVRKENSVAEYRIGFRHTVNSSEDAKSELVKLFQEAWEREEGICFIEDLPPVVKYAEELL